MLIDAVTASNWRDQGDVALSLSFQEGSTGTLAVPIGGTLAAVKRDMTNSPRPKGDTVALLPLPAFRVEIINRSRQVVVLDPSRWTASDGRGSSGHILDDDGVRKEAERVIFGRRRNLYDVGQAGPLAQIRDALGRIPLIGHGRTLAPGEHWQGFVVFDLYSDAPLEHLDVVFAGTQVGNQPDAPIQFAFVSEPPPPRKCAKAGEVASVLGVCPSDLAKYEPATDGPCIQDTRSYFKRRRQWWIDGAEAADSDLYRTLQSVAVPRRLTNRGLKLRIAGWVLMGAGVVASIATAAAISRSGRPSLAPAGLAWLGVPVVGLVLNARGQADIRAGVARYNELTAASGVCSAIY